MSFLAHYENELAQSGFTPDTEQREIASLLNDLADNLLKEEKTEARWLTRFLRVATFQKPAFIRGLYLWGGVGRGKTYLMDMFFQWIPIQNKQRLHFHRFMQLVHAQLTELEGTENPLQEIAESFREQTRLLCFDEFYVSDIGDAMILGELLEALFNRSLVLIATSNTKPQDLYERGLQRRRFLPAIALLEEHSLVKEIGGKTDYRIQTLRQSEIYRLVYPAKETHIEQDQVHLLHLRSTEQNRLSINGRILESVFNGEGVAGFTFTTLCETHRSASDYIELAKLFHTIVIYNIPQLSNQHESAARRFIALIDEFYDRKVNTLFYAAVPIDELYQGSQHTAIFERTQSRLLEMQSDAYLSEAHKA